MKKGKIVFKGNFWDFFLKFLGLIVLGVRLMPSKKAALPGVIREEVCHA
jgi:hypothetical protein